jgi:hypothetical protein
VLTAAVAFMVACRAGRAKDEASDRQVAEWDEWTRVCSGAGGMALVDSRSRRALHATTPSEQGQRTADSEAMGGQARQQATNETGGSSSSHAER